MNILLIIFSVILTGIAQILFKIGMSGFNYSGFKQFVIFLIKNPYIIFGLLIMIVGMFLRFYILSKNEVSFAYPFVAISFIIVVVGGYFLGENINLVKILGILFIIGGIIFISKS